MYKLIIFSNPFQYYLILYGKGEHGLDVQYTKLNTIYNEKINKLLFLYNIEPIPYSKFTIDYCMYSLLEKFKYV